MRYRSQKNFEYGNPLFAQKAQRPWVYRHPRWALAALFVITIGSIYCIYGLPYWQLKNVSLSGTYTLAIEEFKQLTLEQKNARWLLFFRQDKLWSFDTSAYERRLRERWIFSELTVQRRMPGTIVVHVTEERPAYVFVNGTQRLGVDRKGVASTLLVGEPPEKIPTLTLLQNATDIQLGATVLSQNDATFFALWVSTLRARNIPTLAVTGITLSNPPDQTAQLQVMGEWDIVVDRTQDAQKQIDAFFVAYDQKLQGRSLEYVDVTVPARVYYK